MEFKKLLKKIKRTRGFGEVCFLVKRKTNKAGKKRLGVEVADKRYQNPESKEHA